MIFCIKKLTEQHLLVQTFCQLSVKSRVNANTYGSALNQQANVSMKYLLYKKLCER